MRKTLVLVAAASGYVGLTHGAVRWVFVATTIALIGLAAVEALASGDR